MADEKILVVEDEESIAQLICMTLEMNNFHSVIACSDGPSALAHARRYHPDLILLDLMLPALDGLSVCRMLKSDPDTAGIPIIMLTAKSEESDIVTGLELGAADYMTKPFSACVLIARIRAQLRQKQQIIASDVLQVGDLTLNIPERSTHFAGETIDLTFTEFEILALLIKHPGRVFTRNQIVARVKGSDYAVTERAVDVQMLNLRRKLGAFAENIETVRGVGYRLKNLYNGGAL